MDFISELEMAMEEQGVTHKDLSVRLNLSEKVILRVFEDPGKLTLELSVALACDKFYGSMY